MLNSRFADWQIFPGVVLATILGLPSWQFALTGLGPFPRTGKYRSFARWPVASSALTLSHKFAAVFTRPPEDSLLTEHFLSNFEC